MIISRMIIHYHFTSFFFFFLLFPSGDSVFGRFCQSNKYVQEKYKSASNFALIKTNKPEHVIKAVIFK